MDGFSVDVSATARQSGLSGQEAFAEFPVLEFLAQQDRNETILLLVDGIKYGSIGMLTAVVGSPAG